MNLLTPRRVSSQEKDALTFALESRGLSVKPCILGQTRFQAGWTTKYSGFSISYRLHNHELTFIRVARAEKPNAGLEFALPVCCRFLSFAGALGAGFERVKTLIRFETPQASRAATRYLMRHVDLVSLVDERRANWLVADVKQFSSAEDKRARIAVRSGAILYGGARSG
jgi:hypothetical protein